MINPDRATLSSSDNRRGQGMPGADHDKRTAVFDRETYVKMLIAIARADKEQWPPEYRFIRKQAIQLGVDYEQVLKHRQEF
jgi:uncharacterized tellurite resistance protein B-like protein